MCWSCPSGRTGKIKGASRFRIASRWVPTSSTVQDGRYTPGLSAMTARATRPASAMNTSPLTEQDSCASQPTTGATRSGPIGGAGAPPGPGGRPDPVACPPLGGAFEGRDVGQADYAGLGDRVVDHAMVPVQ